MNPCIFRCKTTKPDEFHIVIDTICHCVRIYKSEEITEVHFFA